MKYQGRIKKYKIHTMKSSDPLYSNHNLNSSDFQEQLIRNLNGMNYVKQGEIVDQDTKKQRFRAIIKHTT